MSEYLFEDLKGSNPKVLFIFDKPANQDFSKKKSFSSIYQSNFLKAVLDRGILQEDLAAIYIKNSVDYDNQTGALTSSIEINKKDIEGFIARFQTYLAFNDIQLVVTTGGQTLSILENNGLKYLNNEKDIINAEFNNYKFKFINTCHPFAIEQSQKFKDIFNKNLNSIYLSVYEVTSVVNAEYVSIEKFYSYMNKLLNLYQKGLIECMGFDTETNSVEFWQPWSKITLFSASDRFTGLAYSCATYHPEVWMQYRKKTLWKYLFNKLKLAESYTDNSEFIRLSDRLKKWVSLYKGIELPPYNEVTSEDEDYLKDRVLQLSRDVGGKLKKDMTLDVKKNVIYDFLDRNREALDRIKYLTYDTTYEEKIKKLMIKMDEVLSTIPIIGHNVKFDVSYCNSKSIGIKKPISVFSDTYGKAVALFGTEAGFRLDLETLSMKFANIENGWKTTFHSNNRLNRRPGGTRFDRVPLRVLGPYSAADAIATDKLDDIFKPRIKEYNNVELDKEQNLAISMFSRGEAHGFTIHPETGELLYKNAVRLMDENLNKILNLPIVRKFVEDNPNIEEFSIGTNGAQSHKAAILFRKEYFGFKSIMSTDAGHPSCSVDDVLKPLQKQIKNTLKRYESDPENTYCENNARKVDSEYLPVLKEALEFVTALIVYSGFGKLFSTYLKPVWDEKNKTTVPKITSTFNLVGATATGRISSGFHTMPKQGNIRELYCSAWNSDSKRKLAASVNPGEIYNPPYGLVKLNESNKIITYRDYLKQGLTESFTPKMGGGIIVGYDYSTLEVRVFSALCGDPNLKAILASGADLHSSMARQVFPDILGDKTTEEIKEHYSTYRSYSKTVLFGLLYGKTAFSLADQLDISVPEAEKIVNSLFTAFPGIQTFVEKQHKFAIENGFVVDKFNRVRWVPDAKLPAFGPTAKKFRHAMNVSQNSPIQSGASIAAWIAGSHIQEEMVLQGMNSIMLGGVHDSTYNDCYPGEMLDLIKICLWHADTVPNVMYDWIDGNNLKIDLGLGQSWGRELDVKSCKFEDGYCYIKMKGGDVNWEFLKRELDQAYEYEILEIKEGDELEEEVAPIPLSKRNITVEIKVKDNNPDFTIKSCYYVGNKLYKRDSGEYSYLEEMKRWGKN